AVRAEVLGEVPTEVLLGRAVRRAVVVREVEVRDAQVERAAQHGALGVERVDVTEVVPEPERDRGQVEAAAPRASVGHRVVAVVGGDVAGGERHGPHSAPPRAPAGVGRDGPRQTGPPAAAGGTARGQRVGVSTTWPAHANPPPKPKSSAGTPAGILPACHHLESPSGMDAAEVLPDSTMSVTTTFDSRPSALARGSMMRRFAWCATSTSMSSSETPERSTTVRARSAARVMAHLKTARPSWANFSCGVSMSTAGVRSGSEPHVTGPTPGSSVARSTAAPAPSAVRMHVLRSVQSVNAVSFSAPITTAVRAEPARIAW